MKSMFSLGFPSAAAPWAYQNSLGISLKEVEDWWKTNEPAIKQDITNAQAGGLGPGNAPKPGTVPMAPRMMAPPSSGTSDTTVLLVSVLLVGGAIGGYYFYKQSKLKKNGKAAKA